MTDQKKAYLYTLFVVVIWATVASAFKITLRYLDHIQMLTFASFFSLVVFFIMLAFQKKLHLLWAYSKKEYLKSGLLGLLNPFLYYLVLFKAYALLPAQEAQPLNQTWVIILALLSAFILGQKMKVKSIIALCISFLGVVIITTHGRFDQLRFSNTVGIVLALGSAFIWAMFWLYNVKDQRDVVAKLCLNFFFGCTYIFTFILIIGKSLIVPLPGLISAFYVGLFEMGITFVLWLRALKLSKTTAQVSNFIYLVPFLSLAVINLVVGEIIHISTVIGLIFIITGIIIQQKRMPEPINDN
jgi:drug/metabolite transporter (DMT)-like permease